MAKRTTQAIAAKSDNRFPPAGDIVALRRLTRISTAPPNAPARLQGTPPGRSRFPAEPAGRDAEGTTGTAGPTGTGRPIPVGQALACLRSQGEAGQGLPYGKKTRTASS